MWLIMISNKEYSLSKTRTLLYKMLDAGASMSKGSIQGLERLGKPFRPACAWISKHPKYKLPFWAEREIWIYSPPSTLSFRAKRENLYLKFPFLPICFQAWFTIDKKYYSSHSTNYCNIIWFLIPLWLLPQFTIDNYTTSSKQLLLIYHF